MIPQFAGQAAMLVPFALLCRWKYDQPLLPALRLGVRVRDAVRSLPAGLLLAVSVLALAALLRAHDTPSPMQDLMNDPIVGAVGCRVRCVDWSRCSRRSSFAGCCSRSRHDPPVSLAGF